MEEELKCIFITCIYKLCVKLKCIFITCIYKLFLPNNKLPNNLSDIDTFTCFNKVEISIMDHRNRSKRRISFK